ncbi:MAG TPA: hypothetical protein VF337_02715 [Candidatus Limnocylindrales bacterium]
MSVSIAGLSLFVYLAADDQLRPPFPVTRNVTFAHSPAGHS